MRQMMTRKGFASRQEAKQRHPHCFHHFPAVLHVLMRRLSPHNTPHHPLSSLPSSSSSLPPASLLLRNPHATHTYHGDDGTWSGTA